MANGLFIQPDPALQRRQALAQAMMGQGMQQQPIQHWTQGVNQLAQALLGAKLTKDVEQEQEQRRRSAYETITKALSPVQEPVGPLPAAAGGITGTAPRTRSPEEVVQILSGDPATQPFAMNLQMQNLMEQAKGQRKQQEMAQLIQAIQNIQPGQGGIIPTLSVGPQGLTATFDPTKRQPEDKPLSPAALKSLRNAEGKPPPPGTTLRDAQAGGYRPISAAEEALEIGQRGARGIIGQMDPLVNKLFKSKGILGRLGEAGERATEAMTQENPDLNAYISLVEGGKSLIVRALGEKGTLAEGDIKRVDAMFPKVFPVPDTEAVAKRKMQVIKDVMKGVQEGMTLQDAQFQAGGEKQTKDYSGMWR